MAQGRCQRSRPLHAASCARRGSIALGHGCALVALPRRTEMKLECPHAWYVPLSLRAGETAATYTWLSSARERIRSSQCAGPAEPMDGRAGSGRAGRGWCGWRGWCGLDTAHTCLRTHARRTQARARTRNTRAMRCALVHARCARVRAQRAVCRGHTAHSRGRLDHSGNGWPGPQMAPEGTARHGPMRFGSVPVACRHVERAGVDQQLAAVPAVDLRELREAHVVADAQPDL